DEGNYNIIMIGRTGKSGLKELVLGSVSSRVLHLAERQTVALVSA
ncbi:MAG TPA: universal stress protein, partial [Thermodesulfatator atlanticus]|nr:universal stress protein [Thermodesulfatator atlanticus]